MAELPLKQAFTKHLWEFFPNKSDQNLARWGSLLKLKKGDFFLSVWDTRENIILSIVDGKSNLKIFDLAEAEVARALQLHNQLRDEYLEKQRRVFLGHGSGFTIEHI